MIDYTLRECPICGNPAEIVEGEPYSFMPNKPTAKIRCSNQWCFMNTVNLRYQPDLKSSEIRARDEWNQRKRKNKLRWDKKYREDGE